MTSLPFFVAEYLKRVIGWDSPNPSYTLNNDLAFVSRFPVAKSESWRYE